MANGLEEAEQRRNRSKDEKEAMDKLKKVADLLDKIHEDMGDFLTACDELEKADKRGIITIGFEDEVILKFLERINMLKVTLVIEMASYEPTRGMSDEEKGATT